MTIPLRVLIVEDSPDDAALLVRLLQQGGYDVTWQLVDRREPMQTALAWQTWDLVFSDHSMPGFSSSAALQTLRDAGHRTPFILVSGISPEEVQALLAEVKAQDCVLKSELDEMLLPVTRRQLRAAQESRWPGGGR
ncbi:MAG: response regulator [Nitrospirota bacterium]